MSATTPRPIHAAVYTIIAPLSPSQTYLPSTDGPVAPSIMYAITSMATIALPMSNIVCLSTATSSNETATSFQRFTERFRNLPENHEHDRLVGASAISST